MVFIISKSLVRIARKMCDYDLIWNNYGAHFKRFCSATKSPLDKDKTFEYPLKTRTEEKNDYLREEPKYLTFPSISEIDAIMPKYWNERRSLKKLKKQDTVFNRSDSIETFMRELTSLKNFPTNLPQIVYWLRKRLLRKDLREQKYLPERQAVLKPDLAAAHFLISRGGSIKFEHINVWISAKEASKLLPSLYVPGYTVEGINAEKTNLRRQGLQNLTDLKNLKWLCLKGLLEIDDWCLDWLSNEYQGLQHLDISGCKNITHRGLSCIHRFEYLKTLIVSDVSDTPEFKVACLMLQDVLPELNIEGINLTIPDKIDAYDDGVQLLSPSQKDLDKV